MDGKKVALGSLILLMTALVGVSNALNFGADAKAEHVAPNGDIDPEATSVFLSDNAEGIGSDTSGYIATSALNATDIVFDNTDMYMYATSAFSMRAGPGVYFMSMGKLYYGQEVHVIGTSEPGWYKVEYNGNEYYTYHACLTETEPAARSFTDDYGVLFDVVDCDAYATMSYYIKNGPGVTYDTLGTLTLGQRVHIIGRSFNGWNYIEINGIYCYVYGECVKAESNEIRIIIDDVGTTLVDVTGYAHSYFTVRSAPSADSDKIGSVRYGDEIHITGVCDNGYYEIEQDGQYGYILGASVQFTEPRRRDVDEDIIANIEAAEAAAEEEETEEPEGTEPTPTETPSGNDEPVVVTGSTDGTEPATEPTEPEGGSTITVTVDVETDTTDTAIVTDGDPASDPTEPVTVVTAEATATPTPSPTPSPTPTPVPETPSAPEGYLNPSEAQRLLQMVNDYRAANGLGPLSWSSELESAAGTRATEISMPNCFSHTRPDGSDYWTANSALIYGENIAAGQATAENVFDSWINSDAHRGNILGNYTIMGAALYVTSGAAYTYYWAQEFG